MSFTAAVVGLGNIGLGYDYDCADASRVLTHAAGFAHHPGFELVAGVDPDPAARDRFVAKYGRPAYADVDALFRAVRPEVVSLGVGTARHAEALRSVLVPGVKAVLCEKPLAATLAEGREMVLAAQAAHCLLLVNYMRRFDPGVAALKRLLDAGELGTIYKGTAWYGKGLNNNGSHLIDLLTHLLGEATAFELLAPGEPAGDPEPDVRLRLGAAEIYMLANRAACFSHQAFELFGEGGVVRYEGDRLWLRPAVPSERYAGYRVLAEPGTELPMDMARYQWHVLAGLHGALSTGARLVSDGRTALSTLETVSAIIERTKEATHA